MAVKDRQVAVDELLRSFAATLDESVHFLGSAAVYRRWAEVRLAPKQLPVEEAARRARGALLRQMGDAGVCRWCGCRGWWIRMRRHGAIDLFDSDGRNHTLNCPKRPGRV